MKAITLESKLPNAGHYVPGMISGQTLYISGQLPVHHETGAPMAPDLAQQTQDALHNVERVLLAAGCGREDVVLCRVYMMRSMRFSIITAAAISPPASSSPPGRCTTAHWSRSKPSLN